MTSVLMLFFLINALIAMLVLYIITNFTNSKSTSESSNKSFECGFESVYGNRPPFCLQFFCISMVFLVFDLEVIIFLPVLFFPGSFLNLLMYSIMCFVLLVGLIIEWYDGSLEWTMY